VRRGLRGAGQARDGERRIVRGEIRGVARAGCVCPKVAYSEQSCEARGGAKRREAYYMRSGEPSATKPRERLALEFEVHVLPFHTSFFDTGDSGQGATDAVDSALSA